MLIEAAKGGHTNVVQVVLKLTTVNFRININDTNIISQVLIDYPNSLVTTGIMEAAAPAAAGSIPADQAAQAAGQLAADRQLAAADKCNLKKQRVTESSSSYLEYPDLLEGSGFVLEGLEEKGLDAKSYIQVNKYLNCTQNVY